MTQKGSFTSTYLLPTSATLPTLDFTSWSATGQSTCQLKTTLLGTPKLKLVPEATTNPPLAICRNVWSSLSVSKGLDLSWFTFSTSIGATPDSLACYLEFPYGLYDSSGASLAQKTVKIACEWRGVTDAGVLGSWTKFNSNFDAASVIEITDTTTSPKKVQFVTDEHFPYNYDHYEIRMKFAEDPQFSSLVVGACNWTGLTRATTISLHTQRQRLSAFG